MAGPTLGAWSVIGGLLMAGLTPAFGQTVERHPAPVLAGAQGTALTTAGLANGSQDATPFGVALSAVVVVDAHTHGPGVVRRTGGGAVDTTLAGPTAQSDELRATLAKFVGQPLSYRLITALEAEITKFYRGNGRSLVSVTVPPQEVTGGVVQINVNTFVLDKTQIEGAAGNQGFVARQIRLKPGQEVDTDKLLADVNWLNLNPFRHVSVVFEPGAAPDSTNLILKVQNGRPWSAYLGASNAGTKDTGEARLFGGFNMSALPWQDHQLSYQFNGSPDSLAHGDLWNTGTSKGYLSHALTYFIPITTNSGFRSKLTFGVSHISSYSVPNPIFTTGSETSVLNAELAFPLPKTSGAISLVPEVYLQAEADTYDKQPYFVGFPFGAEKTKLVHGVIGVRAGMSGTIMGKKTRGNLDLGLVFGRQTTVGDAAVTYSAVKLAASQEVFFDRDRSVNLRVNAQYSGADGRNGRPVLHPLEQLALGGSGTVRGYPVNGASGQTAVAASVEYRAAPLAFKAGKADGTLRPHVFADLGAVRDSTSAIGTRVAGQHLMALGLGGDIAIGDNLVGTIDLAKALSDAGVTTKGTVSLAVQFTARF